MKENKRQMFKEYFDENFLISSFIGLKLLILLCYTSNGAKIRVNHIRLSLEIVLVVKVSFILTQIDPLCKSLLVKAKCVHCPAVFQTLG